MRLGLRYLDCCLPDYFLGFGGTVFAIPVTGTHRVHQVRTALQDEIDRWDGWIGESEVQIGEDLVESLHQAAHDVFDGHPFATCFPSLPKAEAYGEDGETPYAYFGLLVEETKDEEL